MKDSEEKTEDRISVQPAATEQTADAGLIPVAVKAVAVTLSVVMLVLAILTVAMPLSAMRVFNNLGMSERALNSAETYISRHIRGADDEDELGNFKTLSQSRELVTADFLEALDTCIALSDKLMRNSASRKDDASTEYFAGKLERYTRMFASLAGVNAINSVKDEANLAAVRYPSLHPFVYSNAHTNLELNFRARTYLAATDKLLYVSNIDGDCVTTTTNRANTFAGLDISSITDPELKASAIGSFADYCSQLDEYISAVFERLGVPLDFNEGDDYSEAKLATGYEFSLFITPEGGFTTVYNNLKSFGKYMQAAVDLPATTESAMLRRLYLVGELMSAAQRMWSLATLLWRNRDVYGASSAAVNEEYNAHTCELYYWVKYDGEPRIVSDVYDIYKNAYVALVAGNA